MDVTTRQGVSEEELAFKPRSGQLPPRGDESRYFTRNDGAGGSSPGVGFPSGFRRALGRYQLK